MSTREFMGWFAFYSHTPWGMPDAALRGLSKDKERAVEPAKSVAILSSIKAHAG